MSTSTPFNMARTRALMTETERRLIAGEGEDQRRYEAISRVRARVNDELTTDIEILEENHPDLLDELHDVVCADGPEIRCPICGKEFKTPNNAVHHMTGPTVHDLSQDEAEKRSPDWWSEEARNFYFDDGEA